MQSLQLSWDSYPDDRASIESLDKSKVDAFIARVREGGRFAVAGDRYSVLEKLGYIKDDIPSHAAVLLFGIDDPPYSLHIGRFKTAATIIDDRMIRGTLFDVVDAAMKFIMSHIKVAFEIGDTIQRKEIPEYPIPALRELLLNAVVHRDYTSPTDIQIKIFDDHITFFNPGKLYGELTIEALKTDRYQSSTRNKLIAEAFYLTRDIEKYGSGYIRVRNEITAYPTMRFEYEESGDGYMVSLDYTVQRTTVTPPITPLITPPITGLERRILALLTDSPYYSSTDLAKELSIGRDTVKEYLARLKKRGILSRQGSPRSGQWMVHEDQL